MKQSKAQLSLELVSHRTYDANPNVHVVVDFGKNKIWVTQRQIAELVNTSVQAVNRLIQNFKRERGSAADPSINKLLIVTEDGKQREVEHYDMTVVAYVGFRAHHSEEVQQFQDWAGRQLNQVVAANYADSITETDSNALFLEVRQNGTISRKALTDAIQKVVVNANPTFYGTATNDVYRGVFGRDTKQLKRDLQTESPRDKMSVPALAYLSIAEFFGSQQLNESDELTIPQARQVIQEVAGRVGMQVNEMESLLGIDIVTGRKLLGAVDAIRGA
jgi:hypothetical protein